MKSKIILSAAVFASVTAQADTVKPPMMDSAKKPNVIIILADDLGWSDISPFGGEIQTPNLQELANNGVRFTNFQAMPFSAPSRAALLTGAEPHLVGLGNLSEFTTPEQKQGNPEGYAGQLNEKSVTIAEYLKKSNYFTVLSGKWHLGLDMKNDPSNRGFDQSFTMLRGEYYHYPSRTLDKDGKQYQYGSYKDPNGVKMYRMNGEYVQEPQNFFATDSYTDFMIQQLQNKPKDQPFFGFLSFTAPHSPLQAPQKYIDKYKDLYKDGPRALAEQRFKNVQKLGLVDKNAKAPELVGLKDWDSLTELQRAESSKRMQLYAAMIDNMDENIGRLVASLKEKGELDNTIIMFMSDNGAAGNSREDSTRWGPWISQVHDNSLENMGRENTYISTGPEWAQASSTPFYLFKALTTEGGLRSPLIVTGLNAAKGQVSAKYANITDVAPTLLDVIGVEVTTPADKVKMTGESFKAELAKPNKKHVGPKEPRIIENMGSKSVRYGNFKALANSTFGNLQGINDPKIVRSTWQLFDLAKDPGETTDLAAKNPKMLKKLVDAYYDYAKDVGVVEVSPTNLVTQ